ncbi:MAG TPA: PAS domain-containing sensor histidine kinase [Polyangiaceae bacterium]|nr:PAS domain-containing sensor histidine kinase [Polyangiaceae bacterium]
MKTRSAPLPCPVVDVPRRRPAAGLVAEGDLNGFVSRTNYTSGGSNLMMGESIKSAFGPEAATRTMKPSRARAMCTCAGVLALVAGASVIITWSSPTLGIALVASMGMAVSSAALVFGLVVVPKLRACGRLASGLSEFTERKFSARLGPDGERVLGELAARFDAVGAMLGSEQGDSAQRELLLRTIVGSAPMAIVLYGDAGRIVYSNDEARELFFEGKALEGHNFLHMLKDAPGALRDALLTDTAALFTLEDSEDRESYHLAKQYFDIDGEPHTLVMVKHLTRELGRREAEVYKRVIRVISHEFNNSLAPITSLIHSARLIAKKPEHLPKLERVLDTIEERATHLNGFLEGYASFARLPRPKPQVVAWPKFLEGVKALWPAVEVGPPPSRPGYFDAAQIQQVLINLVKNADEAKGARSDVGITVESTPDGGTRFLVSDRGNGMSCETLKNACEPFFSTKERGSGVGLALCREIIEAHNGKLRIEARAGGGTVVSCWLPGQDSSFSSRTSGRLTLTRG